MNTNYWRNKIMNSMYGSSSGNTFYLGLSSSEPTKAGANVTEPSGGGYARARITGFTTASNGSVSNSGSISFPESEGIWFPATRLAAYWVVFDGLGNNANVLSSGTLATPIGVWDNTVISIPPGNIVITLTDGDD